MNDHAMKAAPRKTGAIILGGGARIMCWIWDRMRWHGRCSNCQGRVAACARCARNRIASRCPASYVSFLERPPRAGVPKHHICNANLMKNGADFAVFVNTAQEFDGSDSGAVVGAGVVAACCGRTLHAAAGLGLPPSCAPSSQSNMHVAVVLPSSCLQARGRMRRSPGARFGRMRSQSRCAAMPPSCSRSSSAKPLRGIGSPSRRWRGRQRTRASSSCSSRLPMGVQPSSSTRLNYCRNPR